MTQKKQSRMFLVLRETFYDYVTNSKINGMYYLRREVSHGYIRIFWSLLLFGMLCFGGLLAFLAWIKFVSFPTQMTIAEQLEVKDIPFPAITICHPQSVIDYQVTDFMKKIVIPNGVTKEEVANKLIILSMFTEYQWDRPDPSDIELIDTVLELNNYTVTEAIDALGTTCTDFLLRCFFLDAEFPCFQNDTFISWRPSFSFLGACCSFNYNPEQENDNYFKLNNIGMGNSLTVLLTGAPQISDGKSGALYSDGLILLVHHPRDFAVQEDPMVLLEQNVEKFVEVYPTALTCSDETMRLPKKARTCMVAEDVNRAQYRQPECLLSCKTRLVHERCRCHPYHLPVGQLRWGGRIRDCRVKDVMCFVDNFLDFNAVQCPECLPSCFNTRYEVKSFKAQIAGSNLTMTDKYKIVGNKSQEMLVSIYMSNQHVPHNRRIIVISLIQLLANIGGSFNLVFGASTFSILEVLYAFTVRFWKHWREQKRMEKVIFTSSRKK